MNELIAGFGEYFAVILAESPRLQQEVFRLRYQVYCREMHFLDACGFPAEAETDSYDRRSVHILLQHRPSGDYVGTARLVLADILDPEQAFPIEQCATFDPGFGGVPVSLRRHTAEISRLAILGQFPHHDNGHVRRYDLAMREDKSFPSRYRRFPNPVLALVVGIVQASIAKNITHWYAIMDPSLHRLLSHFHLQLQPIGPIFDHHGPRRPHFDSIKNVMDSAYHRRRNVWELVTDGGRLWSAPGTDEGALSAKHSYS